MLTKLKNNFNAIDERSLLNPDVIFNGWKIIKGKDFMSHINMDGINEFKQSWYDLPTDPYQINYDIQRYQRFGTLYLHPESKTFIPKQKNKAFLQKTNFVFDSIFRYSDGLGKLAKLKLLKDIILKDFKLFNPSKELYKNIWKINVYQILIKANNNLGTLTPEGICQDGHHFLAMHMIERKGIIGGVSSIYDKNKKTLCHFILSSLFDTVLIDDRRFFHLESQIFSVNPNEESYKNMLLLDFNLGEN